MAHIVVRLDEDAAERFEKMHQISGSADISDTVRDALQVYEYLLERVGDGCVFTMAKPGCEPEPLVIFALEEC